MDVHNDFEFTPGDRQLLKEVASFTAQKDSQHFRPDKKCTKKLIRYYSDNYAKMVTKSLQKSTIAHTQTLAFDFDDLEKKLRNKVDKSLKDFQMSYIYEKLKDCAILVEMNFDQKVYGSIKCSFCDDNSITVHLRIESPTSMYWVISNFMTHLKNFHKFKTKSTKRSKMADEPKINTVVGPIKSENEVIVEEVFVEIAEEKIEKSPTSTNSMSTESEQIF